MKAAPRRDIVLITFDALRYDVAETAFREGQTPTLAQWIPQGWQPRHTPGSFTYAAHAAIFAGFWPTPVDGGEENRPFALHFPGSRSIGPETRKLSGETIVDGLAHQGYTTICIGGVGFFNPATPLGGVFPGYFQESHWRAEFSVSALQSAEAQVGKARECIERCDVDRPLFLFINFSATHPPTRGYLPQARQESVATQAAALAYVDRQLPELLRALEDRPRGGAAYLMSDHGTLFGEDGRTGHRLGHPLVWTVPYAECSWGPNA